jgi:hypothetical protein
MQTVSAGFNAISTATVRPVRAVCWIAWERTVEVDQYARVGTAVTDPVGSVVGGVDLVRGAGEPDINETDYYKYDDETARVVRLEYERNLIEPLGGIAVAMADIVLDNTDLRFTPGYDGTIGDYILPNRPVKIFIGFEVDGVIETVSIIEGLSLQPREDKAGRTVAISVYDFMESINTKPQETTIYTSQRSDEIIEDILSRAGIGASNYALDTGLNTIGFAWFEKGQTAGRRIRRLCEAEEAIFFQDETGILRFENRDKYSESPYDAPAWTIEPEHILEWMGEENSEIINRVIVRGAPRSVKAEAEVWRDGVEEEVDPNGGTLTIWADFEDPVSDLTDPAANTDYTAYTATGGGGVDITANVSIVMTEFTKAAKLVITNNSNKKAYINLLKLRGTPATVDYEIKEVWQDDDSVDTYNEHQKEVENPYIDDRDFAEDMAANIVRRHKDPLAVLKLKIRGIPQLQLRDWVWV